MARGNETTLRPGAAAASLALLLVSCGQPDEPAQPETRITGVTDERYYVHPKAEEPGRTVVKGCCTFDLGDAQVTQMTGDVDGRIVRGPGYELEIAFGDWLGPLPKPYEESGERTIDGVKVTEFRGKPRQFALTATVPLSQEAIARRVDFPQLQVSGRCDGPAACARLEMIMRSIRF